MKHITIIIVTAITLAAPASASAVPENYDPITPAYTATNVKAWSSSNCPVLQASSLVSRQCLAKVRKQAGLIALSKSGNQDGRSWKCSRTKNWDTCIVKDKMISGSWRTKKVMLPRTILAMTQIRDFIRSKTPSSAYIQCDARNMYTRNISCKDAFDFASDNYAEIIATGNPADKTFSCTITGIDENEPAIVCTSGTRKIVMGILSNECYDPIQGSKQYYNIGLDEAWISYSELQCTH